VDKLITKVHIYFYKTTLKEVCFFKIPQKRLERVQKAGMRAAFPGLWDRQRRRVRHRFARGLAGIRGFLLQVQKKPGGKAGLFL
jgi:hypothetical protein